MSDESHEITFVFYKATQTKFRYKQALPAHADPIHNAECPDIYLSKAFVREFLGDAQVITATFREGE